MNKFLTRLSGGDLRSISDADSITGFVKAQPDFDELFKCLYNGERVVRMRAADAIEKISLVNNGYLQNHKEEILRFLKNEDHIEFKWHLAQLVSRLKLNSGELDTVWHILKGWLKNESESRIVRVNALQALYDLSANDERKRSSLALVKPSLMQENIPSLIARVRKLGL